MDELNSVLQKSVRKKYCDSERLVDMNDNKGDLERTRNLISSLLYKLEQDIANPDFFELQENKILWGEKENVVSLLTKLTQMLLKIIPAENQMKEVAEDVFEEEFSDSDMQILREYVDRFGKQEKADKL